MVSGPVLFSGCPVACRQAEEEIPGLKTYSIDKTNGPASFDKKSWRHGLAEKAVASLTNETTPPLTGTDPFQVIVTFRDGPAAAAIAARRWRLEQEGDSVRFEVADLPELFLRLSRICYLSPVLIPLLPVAIPLYRLMGRIGLAWVRRQLNQTHHRRG